MSTQKPAVLVLQVSGVELSDGLPLPAVKKVHLFIVECSPHGYILILKGPGMAPTRLPVALRDDSAPEEVAYASIVNDDLQVAFDVPNCRVDVFTGRPVNNPFPCPFRLTFSDEIDFWRFCGAFGDAKAAQIRRAAKLLEAYEEAVDRILKQLKVDPVAA